ncbi:MAG: hypothetical protein Q8P15_01940 [Nanoarchaeota archaeon]|nr:hypothetical protein [Nanoarchaeota archaeon]
MPKEKIFKPEATDIELVIFLGKHIENPCGMEINGEWEHIRPFYLGIASNLLPELTNPFAKEYLQRIIGKYNSER